MDNTKVSKCTEQLKEYFQNKQMKVSEAKETMFRLMDYIDNHYPEEEDRDCLFTNGNGKTKLMEVKNVIRT